MSRVLIGQVEAHQFSTTDIIQAQIIGADHNLAVIVDPSGFCILRHHKGLFPVEHISFNMVNVLIDRSSNLLTLICDESKVFKAAINLQIPTPLRHFLPLSVLITKKHGHAHVFLSRQERFYVASDATHDSIGITFFRTPQVYGPDSFFLFNLAVTQHGQRCLTSFDPSRSLIVPSTTKLSEPTSIKFIDRPHPVTINSCSELNGLELQTLVNVPFATIISATEVQTSKSKIQHIKCAFRNDSSIFLITVFEQSRFVALNSLSLSATCLSVKTYQGNKCLVLGSDGSITCVTPISQTPHPAASVFIPTAEDAVLCQELDLDGTVPHALHHESQHSETSPLKRKRSEEQDSNDCLLL